MDLFTACTLNGTLYRNINGVFKSILTLNLESYADWGDYDMGTFLQ